MKISPFVRGTIRHRFAPFLASLGLGAFATADVIITEIHFNPDGDDRAREFVEIKNAGDLTENIGGWRFTQGITFTFPGGTTIDPGQFIVLAWNKPQFDANYASATAFGQYGNDDNEPDLTKGALDNADERITLIDPSRPVDDQEIFSVKYWDGKGADATGDEDDFERERWPSAPDGDNYTLVSLDPNDNPDPDDYRNWRPSINLHGSPGTDEPLPPGLQPVYINEVRSRDGILDNDAVELYNPGNDPVNVGQWFVSDNVDNPRKNQIPAGTMVPAGGYLVLTNGIGGFTLSVSSKGERAFLYSATGVGAAATLTGWVHGLHTEASEDGKTFARFVGEDGREHFIADDPSLGQPNGDLAPPRVVITEIMYSHGVASAVDYIKIKNISASTAPLYDVLRNTDNMSIGGFGVTIPGSQPSLAPGEEAFVAPVSEASFRTAYDVDPAARVFGDPMGGNLSGGGERIELRLPVTIDGESYEQSAPLNTNSPRFYAVLDEVRYNDNAPWPTPVRDNGYSLQKNADGDAGFQPSSWSRSSERGGSAFGGPTVYVNEVLAHTDLPQVDVIELYNPGTEPADIGGWFLVDETIPAVRYTINPGTVIPAGGYWAVNQDNDANEASAPANYFGNAFQVGSRGDTITVFSASGGTETGFYHGFRFRATENGVSLGLHVNSEGRQTFPPQSGAPTVQINRNTPFPTGMPNNAPRVERAVISELFFDPGAGHIEFVEVANISGGTLALYDTTPIGAGGNPNNNWGLDGVEFTFPGNRPTLAAGERVVITPTGTDEAAFRTLYNVDPGVTVYAGASGFVGALNNAGEEIALLRPDKPDVVGGQVVVPMIQVDSITYSTSSAWPSGAGVSIERIDVAAFGDEPTNWENSTADELATPGSGPFMPSGYDSWAAGKFTPEELAGPGTAPTEDFNGDGFINLLAYGFGYGPKDADIDAFQPQVGVTGVGPDGKLTISFRRNTDAPDLAYRVQISTDLETWTDFDNLQGSPTDNGDGTLQVIHATSAAVSGEDRQFLRVLVDLVVP